MVLKEAKPYSLYDLNEYVKRVIALNFQQGLWIFAEIGQINCVRGHYYFNLLQKETGDEGDIIAQAQATLWALDYKKIRAQVGKDLDEVLQEGLEVKIKVRVGFHERYGLRLQIEEIDPAFTFGQLAIQRRKTIQTLEQMGLMERNGTLPLPIVLQRIAEISSETAAGFQDFSEHLAQNNLGYRFDCQLFASAMQGKNTEKELPAALDLIQKNRHRFDGVAIIRGGGAKLDLTAFDSLPVCKAVATMSIPVFSGIGHDIDETVLDLVAHTNLKTPTAVADFIIHHNYQFENAILYFAESINRAGLNTTKLHSLELERKESDLHWASQARLQSANWQLNQAEQLLPAITQQVFKQMHRRLDEATAIANAHDPANILRRGFSLTRKDGQIVTDAATLSAGDVVETQLADGVFRATVKD